MAVGIRTTLFDVKWGDINECLLSLSVVEAASIDQKNEGIFETGLNRKGSKVSGFSTAINRY